YSWLFDHLYRKNRGIFLPECASCSCPKQGSPPLYVAWPGSSLDGIIQRGLALALKKFGLRL
ncbi:unnamed protein product, partial [Musa banksii]